MAPTHRSDIHYSPPALLHHAAQASLAKPVHGAEIGVNDVKPFLIAHAHQEVVFGDSCIIHQHRHWPLLGRDLCHQSLHRSAISYIQHLANTVYFGLGKTLSDGLCARSLVAVPQRTNHCYRALRLAAPIPRLAPVTNAIFDLTCDVHPK